MALVLYNPIDSEDRKFESTAKGYVGLKNQGATCYLNSVLQTLYMTPEFRRAIYSWKYDAAKDGPEDSCIPYQIQKLFGFLQLSTAKYIDTRGITTSFGWTDNDVFQQQDAQELFRVLFDALEETFKDTSMSHIIDHIFAGEMVDYIRCLDVDYESERTDKFLDFSLAIIPFGKSKALPSLTKCIEMFLRPEILDGENQYFAESVGKRVDAIKGFKFGDLPTVMTISLKRFVYDFSDDAVTQKKLNDVVRFPMVLDMNKYISSKSRISKVARDSEASSGRTSRYSSDSLYEDEFEEFLAAQMNKLRHVRNHSQKSKHSPNLVDGDKSPTSEEDSDEPLSPLPDLVDYFGVKAPDQISEDLIPLPTELQYESVAAGPEELKLLIEKRGEWIYELYAVLIHSGALTGGHYYAYIKNSDSRKWYNFNDSSVTEIEEKDVQEAWGREIKQYGYNNWTSSSTFNKRHSNFSSANAYMLLYRKVNLKEPVKFPSNDEVPSYISDLVKQVEEEQRNLKQAELDRKSSLNIYIYWKGKPTSISAKSHDTFEDFFIKIWKSLQIIDEPEFVDLIEQYKHLENKDEIPCPLHRMRLRFYALSISMCYEPYMCNTESERKQMLDQKISKNQNYTIEFLPKDDVWDDYHVNGVNVLATIYDVRNNVYLPHIQVSLPSHATVANLKTQAFHMMKRKYKQLIDYIGVVDALDCRCYRTTAATLYSKSISIEMLKDDNGTLWGNYKVCFGEKVYIEYFARNNSYRKIITNNQLHLDDNTKSMVNMDNIHDHINSISINDTDDEEPEELEDTTTKATAIDFTTTPAYIFLTAMLFHIKLSFNIPPSSDFTETIEVDSRILVSDLRGLITDAINKHCIDFGEDIKLVDKSRVRLFLLFKDGRELTGENSLRVETVADGGKIFVSIGFIPPPYHHALKFYLYKPPEDVNQNVLLIEDCDHIDIFTGYSESTGAAPFNPLSPQTPSLSPSSDNSNRIFTPFIQSDAIKCQESADLTDVRSALVFEESSIQDEDNEVVVEPSDFAVKTVSCELHESNIEALYDIDCICANDDTLVDKIRDELLIELRRMNLISADKSSKHIRIRDLSDKVPGRILVNGSSFRAQGCYLHATRNILVEILSDEDIANEAKLKIMGDGNALVSVQVWHRSTWSLGKKREALLLGDMSLGEVFNRLAIAYGINPENMLILALRSYFKVSLCDLNQEIPKPLTRGWQSYLGESTKLKDLTLYDSKLKHGDLLLLQDKSQPLKHLTKSDVLSLQIMSDEQSAINDMYGNSGYYHGFSTMFGGNRKNSNTVNTSGSYSDSVTNTAATNNVNNSSGNAGIKIKLQRDKSRDLSTTLNNGEESSDKSSLTSFDTTANDSSKSICIYDDDTSLPNADHRALFSDINEDT